MISRLHAYLECVDTMEESDLLDTPTIDCPWVYARRHIYVSAFYYEKYFHIYFIFQRLLCSYEYSDLRLMSLHPSESPLPALLPDYNDL